jgi:hypothetical protein
MSVRTSPGEVQKVGCSGAVFLQSRKGKTMKAEWILDYDHTTDKCYKRPGCPECNAPVGEDGVCFSCGVQYALDDEMTAWFNDMSQSKTEITKCWKCGADNCLETMYYKNPVTREWQAANGMCRKCGMRFIV